jgi:hypothetical protein
MSLGFFCHVCEENGSAKRLASAVLQVPGSGRGALWEQHFEVL